MGAAAGVKAAQLLQEIVSRLGNSVVRVLCRGSDFLERSRFVITDRLDVRRRDFLHDAGLVKWFAGQEARAIRRLARKRGQRLYLDNGAVREADFVTGLAELFD